MGSIAFSPSLTPPPTHSHTDPCRQRHDGRARISRHRRDGRNILPAMSGKTLRAISLLLLSEAMHARTDFALSRWSSMLVSGTRDRIGAPIEEYALGPELRLRETDDGTDVKVSARCEAFSAPDAGIRCARSFVVGGNGPFQVLNFVIFPDEGVDAPIFSADIVSMPGQHLVAIDHQPLSQRHYLEEGRHLEAGERVDELWRRYQPRLLPGGDVPEEARRFFSPAFLWARQPLDDPRGDVVAEALEAYLEAYMGRLEGAVRLPEGQRPSAEQLQELSDTQHDYCAYRRDNDPGARVLLKFFGAEWTDALLRTALFPVPP